MSWREKAACSDPSFEPDWWFPTTESDPKQTAIALEVCNELCPIRDTCLKKYDGGYGIWGGRVKKVWDTKLDS